MQSRNSTVIFLSQSYKQEATPLSVSIDILSNSTKISIGQTYRGYMYLFLSVKDRNLFHRVDTIGNIFMSGAATSENITDGVHEIKFHEIKFRSFTEKKPNNKYSVYFMLLTLSGRGFIKIQFSSFPLFPVVYPLCIATQLQYYVKREKCKVSDVIFPSGCEARAINLGNKNMKISIFTGATSVRLKSIFTDIVSISYRKA